MSLTLPAELKDRLERDADNPEYDEGWTAENMAVLVLMAYMTHVPEGDLPERIVIEERSLPKGCNRCGRSGGREDRVLTGKCHFAAPTVVSIESDFLVLRCYDCRKLIKRFEIVGSSHVTH